MTKVFGDVDIQAVFNQKKRLKTFYFITLGVFIAIIIALFVLFRFEPYERSAQINAYKWSFAVVSFLFLVYSYVLFSVKFSRVKNYYKMQYYIKNGIKEKNEGTFVRFSRDIKIKDGVDFYTMALLEWSDKEQDYLERYVLLDVEKPFPPFEKGDKLYYITQSNILCEWEINN